LVVLSSPTCQPGLQTSGMVTTASHHEHSNNIISNIRQVPDHQEIYLDANGFTNVIVEINQRVPADEARTDIEALKYHFKDIVSTETDEVKFWGEDRAKLNKMPYVLISNLKFETNLDDTNNCLATFQHSCSSPLLIRPQVISELKTTSPGSFSF
jgi:hypothetical protein